METRAKEMKERNDVVDKKFEKAMANGGEMPEEDVEEGSPSKGIRYENKPSAREVEEHERTHLPFRNWCHHCIMGRGKEDQHRKRDRSEQDVPKIIWDYMYMKEKVSKNGIRDAIVEGEGNPIVVLKDSLNSGGSGGIIAFAVPNKGMCDYAIQKGYEDINQMFWVQENDIQV